MRRPLLLAAALSACFAPGQSAKRPEFEVTSVKRNTANGPSDFTPRRAGDRVIMHNMQLGPMIAFAYSVPRGVSMEGGWRLPDGWNWYDVEATVAGSPSEDEIRLMFQ